MSLFLPCSRSFSSFSFCLAAPVEVKYFEVREEKSTEITASDMLFVKWIYVRLHFTSGDYP